MHRVILLAALALTSGASAANITSTTCTSTITTGCVKLNLSSYPNVTGVAVQVGGTWEGTLAFEGSNDNSTFVELRGYPVAGGSYPTSVTGNGAWTVPTGGLIYFRVRASSWTSGTAVVVPQPTTSPIAVDLVRAVGSTFGDVAVSGTVNAALTTASLDAIAAPDCDIAGSPPVITLTTTEQTVPSEPFAERTQLIVKNLSSVQNVLCCVGAGCSPTTSAAYVILPSGDYQNFPVRATGVVRCRSEVGTAAVNAQEASCG